MESTLLIQFGDHLDGIDHVMEKNHLGFNKFDKPRWLVVRGNTPAMKKMLVKYKRQLTSAFGEDSVNSVNWEVEKVIIPATASFQAVESGHIGVRLTSPARIESERFMGFVNYLKSKNAKCDASRNYLWILPKDFSMDNFKSFLIDQKIEIGDLPKPTDITKDVVVKKNDAGHYEVYHPYSEKLNSAYRSAEETSGIIGFDWNKKCRLVGKNQIDDLDEILAVIGKHYPDWEIQFDFDIETERAHLEKQKMEMRTDETIREILKDGVAPLPYQIEGCKIYEMFNGCALNGDDMGLGKTFQTLLYAARNQKKMLVVCPKNVRRQWIQEADKFFKNGIFVGLELNSKSKIDSFDGYNLVTCNYEILDRFNEIIKKSDFDLLVLDESHRIKNAKAKTTRLIMSLRDKFLHKICLSGTPIKNKKREIFTQANLISPQVFTSENEILMATNFNVREKMKKFFFRRTKKQELKDLPEKFRSIVPIDAKGLPDLSRGCQIGDISRIKSELAQAKVSHTCDFVGDILDNSDSKVIVFSDSDDAANAIAKHFGVKAVLHVGATAHEKREKAKEVFNDENSDVRVFVATTGSAREGLNLTIADKVVFNDLPWTPADLNQAESRAHRLGQKNCVNIYWMQVENNVFDQNSVEILNNKMKIYEALINGKKLSKEEQEVMKRGVSELLAVKALLGF